MSHSPVMTQKKITGNACFTSAIGTGNTCLTGVIDFGKTFLTGVIDSGDTCLTGVINTGNACSCRPTWIFHFYNLVTINTDFGFYDVHSSTFIHIGACISRSDV
jgi:hypothetical protein